jgi:ribosomal protein S18 acetylase RimI-like enzyme
LDGHDGGGWGDVAGGAGFEEGFLAELLALGDDVYGGDGFGGLDGFGETHAETEAKGKEEGDRTKYPATGQQFGHGISTISEDNLEASILVVFRRTMDCSNVQLRMGQGGVDLDQLQELFNLVAFWASDRRRQDLQVAISNSNPVVSAWDADRMVGFSRGNSDGVYRATIWDVVVHPDYQGAGLGRKLVETILADPMVAHVEKVYLMTTNQQRFYEKIGFRTNSSTTMVLNYQAIEQLPLTESLSSEEFVSTEQG